MTDRPMCDCVAGDYPEEPHAETCPIALSARIKELVGLLCQARDLALDATDSGDLPDFYGWLDAVNALINEGIE